MITRRHIRLKVMQTLYSYFSNSQNDLKIYEKVLLKDIYSISNLHVIIFSFLLELHKFAKGFFEDNKFKFIPTEEDLNPNTKYVLKMKARNNDGLEHSGLINPIFFITETEPVKVNLNPIDDVKINFSINDNNNVDTEYLIELKQVVKVEHRVNGQLEKHRC